MGTIYKYSCDKCGFEDEYSIGVGFFTEEYFAEGDILREQFRSDILNGKYGEMLKVLVQADTKNRIFLSCETELFQCDKCYKLLICRERKITDHESQYRLSIKFSEDCPDCGKGHLWVVDHLRVRCPKCKTKELTLFSIGKWD